MLNNLANRVFGHWQSTVAGVALAVSNVVLNGRTPHAFGISVAVAVFGALVKV